jgi:hypothetical protein
LPLWAANVPEARSGAHALLSTRALAKRTLAQARLRVGCAAQRPGDVIEPTIEVRALSVAVVRTRRDRIRAAVAVEAVRRACRRQLLAVASAGVAAAGAALTPTRGACPRWVPSESASVGRSGVLGEVT